MAIHGSRGYTDAETGILGLDRLFDRAAAPIDGADRFPSTIGCYAAGHVRHDRISARHSDVRAGDKQAKGRADSRLCGAAERDDQLLADRLRRTSGSRREVGRTACSTPPSQSSVPFVILIGFTTV